MTGSRTEKSERHTRLALEQHTSPPAVKWREPSTRDYAACSDGPCRQGRRLCPSPLACRRRVPWMLVAGVALIAAGFVAVGLYAFLT